MKIICLRQALHDAVANVQHAVSAKSTLPALEGILIKASGVAMTLVGYDLNMGITTTIEAEIEEPGEIVLPAKLLGEMVRKLPEETVQFKTDDKQNAVITCGGLVYKITGLSAEEYPELPTVSDGVGVTLPRKILKSMISQTLFAVAVTDERPVHTGVLFELGEDLLRLVAVDGSRLAMRCEPVKCGEPMQFIIPGKTLGEIRGMLTDEDKPLSLVVGRRHVVMEIDGYAIISRLLEGEFLPYQKAIPQNVNTTVRVNARKMIDAVERASLVISDRVKSPLLCEFKDNKIIVSCTTPMGSVVDSVPAGMEGEVQQEDEIGFNSKFLLEALKNTDTDEIRIELCGPLAPMKLLPPSGEDFLFLVLPVRLKR